MAWFQKKKSPVDRRLDDLNNQIAELEAQLRKQQEEDLRRAAEAAAPTEQDRQSQEPPPAAPQNETPAPKPHSRPRFRTTVTPRGVSPVHGIEPHEVDFFARRDKPVDFSMEGGQATPPKSADAKKSGPAPVESKSPGFLSDLLDLFGKPKPQSHQQQLASYLTTGSFQRLKPLRYEKRVARTRLIILVVIVAVIIILMVKFVMR
jgi:pyruvate/2-oxoglutarate dehydrogenase complex dihydrolipoamide acyltransferase (E2) component